MTSFRSLPLKLCVLTLAAALGAPALAADAAFASKAAAGGIAEVEAGGIAQQKGSSPAVKDFAQEGLCGKDLPDLQEHLKMAQSLP